ncbi:MAG: lyase family protein, partial [Pseudomonadota bacterium]
VITRMQPALETTAAEVIARWRQPIPALLKDLDECRDDISQVQWGGPIGTRDHPQPQDLGANFARQLGLTDPGHAWHTDRTRFINAGHLMTRTATAMGKIGEDIAMMAVIGADQITFAGGGSSAMPHKNNPVAAEIAIALSDHCAALYASLTRSARHEGFRSGRAWTLEWLILPQICVATGAAMLQINNMLKKTISIGRAS